MSVQITIELTEKQASIFQEAIKQNGFESPEEYLENCVMGQIIDFRRSVQYRKSAEVLPCSPVQAFDFTELTQAVQTIAKSFEVKDADCKGCGTIKAGEGYITGENHHIKK